MIIYVGYDAESGWVRLSEAEFEARRGLSGAWSCKHVITVDNSAAVRIVVTGGVHPRVVNEIGKRAVNWLVESGYARRVRGALKAVA